jgi:hypothetical protein
MPLTGGDIARRTNGTLELRAQPLRTRWTITDLATSDGHRLNCTFTCSVAAVDRTADRQMLAETFLASREVVEPADIVAHFQPVLTAAAAKLAATKLVEEWLTAASETIMGEALRAAGQSAAFACGLELLPPLNVQLSSPTHQRARLESMERQLSERRAAGQLEHFQRAAELLKRFDDLRGASPALSVGRVLDAVGDADRGATLQTLLMAAAPQAGGTATLWAVGGMELARIGAGGAVESYELPSDVGPPRSLQAGEWEGQPVWLIGCRAGVQIVGALDQRVIATLHDREITSPRGFGAVVLRDGVVTACHSEGGLVRWRIEQPDAPSWTRRPTNGEQPRNLCELEPSRLAYSSLENLFILNGEAHVASAAEAQQAIVALLAHDRDLFVVRADGDVVRKDRVTLETRSRARQCGSIRAAALLPWVGGVRLLLATEDGPVCCVGTEDSLVTQYVSPHRLVALAATNGLIAGVSADRQRMVVWNSWDARQPAAEINVTAKTRHRIADVAFATPSATSR